MTASTFATDNALNQAHPWKVAQLFSLTSKEGRVSGQANRGQAKLRCPLTPWISLTRDWRQSERKAQPTTGHRSFHVGHQQLTGFSTSLILSPEELRVNVLLSQPQLFQDIFTYCITQKPQFPKWHFSYSTAVFSLVQRNSSTKPSSREIFLQIFLEGRGKGYFFFTWNGDWLL